MKIISIKDLSLPEVKIIRLQKFQDSRGYFIEYFNEDDFSNLSELKFIKGLKASQLNQSFSKKDVARGFHFQWNPAVGKLIRTLSGHMRDMVVDIRKESPNFGKVIIYDMPSLEDKPYDEWIWIPPGFAHGNFFTEDTKIEYIFSEKYNPQGEASISLNSRELDWSLCDPLLEKQFKRFIPNAIISEKDKAAISFSDWIKDGRSDKISL